VIYAAALSGEPGTRRWSRELHFTDRPRLRPHHRSGDQRGRRPPDVLIARPATY